MKLRVLERMFGTSIGIAGLCLALTSGCSKETTPVSLEQGIQKEGVQSPQRNTENIDIQSFMPLAVGNSWTYDWKQNAELNCMGAQVYPYFGKMCYAKTQFSKAIQPHEETYKIIRNQGQHYFFTVSSLPELNLKILRDGRYTDSVENCFTWWQEGVSQRLTESIKVFPDSLKMTFYSRTGRDPQYEDIPMENRPADNRNALDIKREGNRWQNFSRALVFSNSPIHSVYDTSLRRISVPAGIFENCIESTEEVYEKFGEEEGNTLLFKTHMLWAPRVGKVREFQELANGDIIYEMNLVRYSVK